MRERKYKLILPALAAMVAMLLAGCVSMAPPYEAPALPVSPAYTSNTTQESISAAGLGWRDYFIDPPLQTLIQLALDNNRDLRTAVLRVEEARAVYGIQRAEQFPAIGAQAGVDRSRVPADLSPTGTSLESSQYQVDVGPGELGNRFLGPCPQSQRSRTGELPGHRRSPPRCRHSAGRAGRQQLPEPA